MLRKRGVGGANRRAACVISVVAVAAASVGLAGPSSAGVADVTGSAFGYSAPNIVVFGQPQPPVGPAPLVTLPPGGSATELEAEEESGGVVFGPATLFTFDYAKANTQGTTGPEGQVGSLVSIWEVPQSNAGEILYTGQITADCSANEFNSPDHAIGGATFSAPGDPAAPNGADFATLRISDGDPNVEGDETYYDIPLDPAPNTVVNGQLENVGDSFQVIFNEQTLSPDGNAITVTAAHVRLLGPNVTGDLYIGQVTCGVTSTGTTTATCGGMTATVVGTPGRDTLTGTGGPDVIVGLGGDDRIFGLEGDDVVCGGGGNDTIEVGAGNDTVSGGAGDDRIVGASGRDVLRGAEGNDTILGGSGNDALIGGPGTDTCTGGTGTNTFSGCEG